MWKSIEGILSIFTLLRKLFDWFRDEQQKQIGRDEVAHDVTIEAAEAENRMRDIARPDDKSVAESLQSGRF